MKDHDSEWCILADLKSAVYITTSYNIGIVYVHTCPQVLCALRLMCTYVSGNAFINLLYNYMLV